MDPFPLLLPFEKVLTMKISLIVAVSRNGVIGFENKLPWHLPDDLKYFKSVTMAKPIIMGRKTYESIGRPLPGRTNIVLTRNLEWHASGVKTASTIEQAIILAKQSCETSALNEIMIIGGEQIYRMTLHLAERLYLTEVDTDVDGDAFFPKIDYEIWEEKSVQLPKVTDKYSYKFVVLDRKELT